MNLLIDIGNTKIKWKTDSINDEALAKSFLYQADTLIADLNNGLMRGGFQPDNIYISNVAGEQIKSKVYQWLADSFSVEPQFAASHSEKCGLISAYKQADQLGVDRFLAMIGACLLVQQPVVVVDCGTATTIDSINSDNEFIGGVIIPGLDLMRRSLSENANALALMDGNESANVFSVDTESAIVSGTILSTTGVIENAVKRLTQLNGCDARCIITGGNGSIIQSHLAIQADYQPDLVLKGLLEYFRVN